MEGWNPYAAPQGAADSHPLAAAARHVPLEAQGRRTAIAIGCVPAFGFATRLLLLTVGSKADGHRTGITAAVLLMAAAIGLVAAFVLAAAFFGVWIHHAEHNLRSLGRAGMVYTPAKAVSSFYIPLVSFVRPPRVVAELWRASDPAPDADGHGWLKQPAAPELVHTWWGALLASGFIQNLTSEANFGPLSAVGGLLGTALMTYAAIACATLMRDIGVRQARAAARLRS